MPFGFIVLYASILALGIRSALQHVKEDKASAGGIFGLAVNQPIGVGVVGQRLAQVLKFCTDLLKPQE